MITEKPTTSIVIINPFSMKGIRVKTEVMPITRQTILVSDHGWKQMCVSGS